MALSNPKLQNVLLLRAQIVAMRQPSGCKHVSECIQPVPHRISSKSTRNPFSVLFFAVDHIQLRGRERCRKKTVCFYGS